MSGDPTERGIARKPTRKPDRKDDRKDDRRDGLATALRTRLKRALFENAAIKFVALVLSITLFVMVNTSKDHVINAFIKVSYNMPEDRVLVSEPVDQVRVTIKGPWRLIKRFDERQVDPIAVDLTAVRGNQYTIPEDIVRLPDGLELEAINPPTIPIQFEPRAERTVPVVVQTAGQPLRGYALERTLVTPAEVKIRGAESVIASIRSVKTREVRLSGHDESFTAALSLLPPQRFVEILNSDSVEVQVVLSEEMIRRDLGQLEVAVRPGTELAVPIDDRFTVVPKAVSVVAHGPRLKIESIESAVAVVKVYADDLGRRERNATVEIEGVPEGVGMEVTPRAVTLKLNR